MGWQTGQLLAATPDERQVDSCKLQEPGRLLHAGRCIQVGMRLAHLLLSSENAILHGVLS